MATWLDLILYAMCLVHFSTVSTLAKTSVTLPDNCQWNSRGSVQCKYFLPEFSSYDPVQLAKINSLKITDCEPITLSKESFAGFESLLILHLECKLDNVELGAFDGLTTLQLLSLHGQDAIVLPDRLFCGLPSLTIVLLTHGSLAPNTSLGFHSQCIDDKFSCGTNISILSLEGNDLTEISYALLCNLPNLRAFNASNNQISKIAPIAFSRSIHLEKLSLSNNSISSLGPDIFQYTTNLTLLDLSMNQLAVIPAGLFRKLTSLYILKLSGNQLTVIQPNAFVDLSNLSELDLSYNSLIMLGSSLSSLKKLNDLNLAGNKLVEIASINFFGLSKLGHLNLDNNLLISFDEMALQFNPNLIVLSINNNKLTTLPNFAYLKQLVSLYASNNNIKTITQTAFQNCSHVFILDFSGNKIELINNQTFANMTFLLKLDLSDNGIKSIENGSFAHLESLKVLDLQNNQLTFEENSYGDTDNMDLLVPLVGLQLLNLSSNIISTFSYSWFPPHLIYLSLSNNLISSLPFYSDFLDPTPHLHILDLSNNQIQNVTVSQFPPSLTHIILSMNKIQSIAPNAFQDLMSLEMLLLRGNSLQAMSPLSMGSALTMVSLRDNPWLCDCKLNWLKDTKTLPYMVTDYLATKCRILFNKTEVDTLSASEVKPDQFLCTFMQDPNNASSCVSSSENKSCLYRCPSNCTCYHDITWKIVKIDCSSANLSKVPEDVPIVTSSYYLDGNSISSIDNMALQNGQSLREIYLNSSKLITIGAGTFKFALNLEVLHLDNNFLETMPSSVFLNLTKLKYLDLSTNQLKNLSTTIFTPLTSLQSLNLQNNKLTNFPVWSFSDNPSIAALSLYNNPWSCECSYALKYREWLQTHLEKLRNISRLHCLLDTSAGPQNVSLTLFNATLCYHTLTAVQSEIPGDNTAVIVIAVCVSIVALVAGLMAFVFRRELKMSIERKFGVRLL